MSDAQVSIASSVYYVYWHNNRGENNNVPHFWQNVPSIYWKLDEISLPYPTGVYSLFHRIVCKMIATFY